MWTLNNNLWKQKNSLPRGPTQNTYTDQISPSLGTQQSCECEYMINICQFCIFVVVGGVFSRLTICFSLEIQAYIKFKNACFSLTFCIFFIFFFSERWQSTLFQTFCGTHIWNLSKCVWIEDTIKKGLSRFDLASQQVGTPLYFSPFYLSV